MRYLLISISFLIVIAGCSTAKIIKLKNDKAVNRVLGSRQLIDEIAPEVNRLYPCDSVAKIGIERVDTMVQERIIRSLEIDTLFSFGLDTIIKERIITINKFRVDTIMDKKSIEILKKQNDNLIQISISRDKEFSVLQSNYNLAKKKSRNYLYILVGIGVLIVGGGAVYVYKKIFV